jgi:hypothetical protein
VNTAVTRAEPTDPKTDDKASDALRDDRVMALDIVRQHATDAREGA